ncbi:hypothetical protein B0J15DRAFT_478208 [Fusarium solani]|uniref:Uncharacterized protein n=1 Tax=Fusarium solani TaxID=169388 RepID=A0A9P9RCE7_FUSSL|nr:uncharacterized protein B0J15DRAFT_478208 [Fusarium solani]KAH7273862.1 hypothetical protein B0J15DRAFT_478208 [Fusarium solani]
MPRRRKSGLESEAFQVRWHSVANIATPSADIMSSPDPLNDTIDTSVVLPSSTRRVPRSSQRSSRFSTLGTSPRKQMFELEVGDDRAPQKLLVTVETEEPSATAGPGSARRKLFQTSSPLLPMSRRREMATTTTVPLKKAIEEEMADPNATPRRRGRPRKTNGTPLPGAGTKRKSGTPIKKTPRRPRLSKGTETGNETVGSNAGRTPGTKRRGRPPKNRPAEPPSELGTDVDGGADDIERRRQELGPEEVAEVMNEAPALPSLRGDDSQVDNEMTLIITPSEAEGLQATQAQNNTAQNDTTALPHSEPDSDIWMATLDDEPTPRPSSRIAQREPAPSSPDHEQEADTSDFGDYGYLPPAGSDVSSADEPESEIQPMNNDTIAAGEDFSMIFMDSLPSLQANLRSSVQEVPENDIGEETSMIINNTLESLRQSLQERDRPNTEAESAEAPKPAEPASSPPREEPRKPSIRPPLTFSPNRNMSPRWLRSPRRMGSTPLRRQVLELNARENADAALEAPEEHDSPITSGGQRSSAPPDHEESNLYDDSFSEIPDAVLEAATPRRPRRNVVDETLVEDEDVDMEDEQPPQPVEEEEEQEHAEQEQQQQPEQEEEQEQEQEQEGQRDPPVASNGSVVSRSDAGRLPTPDDTPPQLDAQEDHAEKSIHMSGTSATSTSPRGSSPAAPSSGQSSASQVQIVPEIVEEVVDEDIEDAVVDEPAEEMQEDNEPEEDEELPDINEPRPTALFVPNDARQPEVTPLNQMTSPLQDPQSLLPEAVSEKVLRPTLSPIVRAGRALQSVTSDPPSPETREQHLRSPFRSSVSRELGPRETQSIRRLSASPGRSVAFPAVTQIPPANEAYEDPFGTDTRHTGQASFMEALERSGGDPSPRRSRRSSRESTASSLRFQPRSEDGMSWVENEGPISANLRGDVPLEAFARSTVGKAKSPAIDRGQLDGATDEADEEPEQDGDDMDIWEFEAQRSSPRAARQHSREKTAEAPTTRRSTLPSPWTKRTSREAQREIQPVAQRNVQEVTEEANEEVEAEEVVEEGADAEASDADATEDAVPEPAQAEEYSLLSQKGNTQQQQNRAPESAVKASRFDLSTFFSSPAAIPGMLAEKFLSAKKPASRPAEPEPVEAEPTLPTSSMFPQLPQQELRPRAGPRAGFFSPVRAPQPVSRRQEEEAESQGASTEQEGTEGQSEPEELEEHEMPSVPQKRNFTPQRRQPSQSFFKTSTQAVAPTNSAPTPPRMQLSHADIQRWQQETSNASEDSPEPSRPLLRPLPPKNASPTKSSLRSPLKPHTPGRVVEFTSSVLSPVEQAKARQQRRLSNSSAASQSSNTAQRPRLRPPPRQNANKENAVASDVSMSDASPVAKQQQPQPLSKTVWTRQHWLFLDELLQLRRQGPYRTNYERRSDKFLGKTVKSQGESMTLERWHLDCVDAFKAEVGGWDEASLAKRLFALILGEERRSQGVVDRPSSRVMFH